MKLLLLLFFLSFITQYSYSQVNMSCNYREVCSYDYNTEGYDNCYKYEENSLFEINEEETVMIHTTETIKSAYYIKSKSVDTDAGIWSYNVTSDVGNEYTYMINPSEKVIGTMSKDKNGKSYVVVFHVKAIW